MEFFRCERIEKTPFSSYCFRIVRQTFVVSGLTCGYEQDVELNAEAWDTHSFDAADVKSLYPQWRSIETITEEGEAMSKRTVQLFQEAKKAKLMEDLAKYTPPDFFGKIPDDGEDPATPI